MAKILENENESPEVDLKNLTVKLAGMGLDEEIEDVIPGKKSKKKPNSDKSAEETVDKTEQETSVDVSESDKITGEEETIIQENALDEDADESDDVKAFYDKRASERDLSIEKVEELVKEMENDDEDPDVKKDKKPSMKKVKKEKKKAKFDAFAICAISLCVLALAGGIFYLYMSLRKEADLGMSMNQFSVSYKQTPIYLNNIEKLGYSIQAPTYRDYSTEDASMPTGVEGESDPTAVTTPILNDYKYFDTSAYCVVDGQLISFFPSMYVTGQESKETGNLKRIRFVSVYSVEDDWSLCKTLFSAFLQAFLPETDSNSCLEKIENAYLQSNTSAEPAVVIEDGDIAYAVSVNMFQGTKCFVMDVMPVEDASGYEYYNVIFG